MKVNTFHSKKFIEKNTKKQKIKKIFVITVCIFILSLFIYLTNANFLRLQQIIVNDVEYSNRSDIELKVKEQLEGRFLGLLSRSNALIFSRSKISREIKNNFPSIKYVDVDLKGFTTIEVQLEEYNSIALWCDTPVTPARALLHDENGEEKSSVIPQNVRSINGSNCFYMNDDGVIFAKAQYDSSGDVVKTFGRINSDPIRQSYTDKKTFNNLIEFTKLLRRLDIVADEVWTTNGEVYAFVTKERVKIYIDSKSDVGKLFDNLETVIERDAINKAQFANIEYIDLRFGNRVFYKLK